MDPASATSLAAAILQLADYTRKVLARSRELYKSADGALLGHTELSIIIKNLDRDLQSLKDEPNAPELSALASKAKEVTSELVSLLERLMKKPAQNSRWRSVRQAILSIWKESQIQNLEGRVQRYRNQVDSALLSDMR